MPLQTLVVIILTPLFVFAGAQPGTSGMSAINVMPMPSSVKVSPGKLRMYVPFTVGTGGYSDPRLERAIVRMQHRLRRRTGLAVPLGLASAGAPPTLAITVKEGGSEYLKFGEDES